MRPDIIILGAGIAGVSAALHLQDRACAVMLVDRGDVGGGTSYGNAGLLERSSVVPYAFPRDLSSLFKYALNRSSDVRYDPFYLPRIAPWLFRYWQQSAPSGLARATAAMLPLIEASLREHDALIARAGAGNLIRENGWISAYKDERRFAAAQRELESLAAHGLSTRILGADEFAALEPAFDAGTDRILGAIHWRDPKTVSDPQALVRSYADLFVRQGGRIEKGDAATLTETSSGWSVEIEGAGKVEARDVVVALGPQSGLVFRKVGYTIPLAVKRGYHRHYRPVAPLAHSVVDEAGGYVLAPMAAGIRLTTGIEFADPAAPANTIQLTRAETLARKLMPLGEPVEQTPWLGLRPCLPDMQPVIGPAPRHRGLWFDFGHAHHGLTLGPATGRLLAEMMTGEVPFADPEPFSPARFH